MVDFQSFSSREAVEEAVRNGGLIKTLLLPAELGGQPLLQNVVYLPPAAADAKERATDDLIAAVRRGLTNVSIVPEYKGASLVPSRIRISVMGHGPVGAPDYGLEIQVW